MEFQSTLPARGATSCFCASAFATEDFNPRSPRGERLARKTEYNFLDKFQSTLPARGATQDVAYILHDRDISIHAPREGSDCFLRLSSWICKRISIHAPREGSDKQLTIFSIDPFYFNPRSPRGERQPYFVQRSCISQFQSTLPARGATAILHRYSRSERQYCNTVTKRGLSSGRKASF